MKEYKGEEIKNCKLGLYKIHWKKKYGGGKSLTSIGYTSDGTRWIAPSNWVNTDKTLLTNKWIKKIKKIVLIVENRHR